MAKVSFKKGLLANLPAAKSEGTFYAAKDERALYLDIDNNTRIRFGDFQEFENLAALQANTNPSTTALYYVADINVLAKWNGTDYVQINLDTGVTSVEVVGNGNAITAASYNPSTRKLTLTAGASYATHDDVAGAIADKVGELKIGEESFATVKAYVDKKTDGIATDAALETLTSRVTAAEGNIDKLNGDKDTEGSVAKAVADAIGTNPDDKTVVELIEAAKEAATYDDTALAGRVTAVEGKADTLIGDDSGKSARAIAAEETAKIVAGADASLDTLKEIADWISSHKTDATAMNSAIVALEAIVDGIGGDGEKATVVAYVNDAIAALKIGDYALAADLTALSARVTVLEGKSHEHANKAELDKIADGDKAKWDAAEQNAKDYADSLADNYDSAGSSDTALNDAKAYVDAALEWGTF